MFPGSRSIIRIHLEVCICDAMGMTSYLSRSCLRHEMRGYHSMCASRRKQYSNTVRLHVCTEPGVITQSLEQQRRCGSKYSPVFSLVLYLHYDYYLCSITISPRKRSMFIISIDLPLFARLSCFHEMLYTRSKWGSSSAAAEAYDKARQPLHVLFKLSTALYILQLHSFS